MTYNHAVKYNGKFYKSGEDVPTDKQKSSARTAKKVVKENDNGNSDNTN